jgi:threonine dehydratase
MTGFKHNSKKCWLQLRAENADKRWPSLQSCSALGSSSSSRTARAKRRMLQALGVELVVHGDDFQGALECSRRLAHERDLLAIPSFDPLLVMGVSSYALELFRGMPEPAVIYVPIGMGSGICGVVAARDARGKKTKVVGVVSSGAGLHALAAQRSSSVTSGEHADCRRHGKSFDSAYALGNRN